MSPGPLPGAAGLAASAPDFRSSHGMLPAFRWFCFFRALAASVGEKKMGPKRTTVEISDQAKGILPARTERH